MFGPLVFFFMNYLNCVNLVSEWTKCNADLEPYPEIQAVRIKGMYKAQKDMASFLAMEDAPSQIENLQQRCMSYDHSKRPTFLQIFKELTELIQELEANGRAKDIWITPDEDPQRKNKFYGDEMVIKANQEKGPYDDD
jgi:hypothetical protein